MPATARRDLPAEFGATNKPHRRANGLQRGPTAARGATITALCALVVLHALGVVGPIAAPVVLLGAVGCGLVGMRLHCPTPAWPWWLGIMACLLWAVAGAFREVTGATGDLSTGRSLLPDLFALPGYLACGAGVYGLLRSRSKGTESDVALDAVMIVVGMAVLTYEWLIVPTLSADDTWVMARLAVVIYPALSLGLLLLSARLAFGSAGASAAQYLLVGGCACLTIGDIVFAAGEVGRIDLPERVFVAPYLFASVAITAAMLHRSSAMTPPPRRRNASPQLSKGRQALVCIAMLAPVIELARRVSSAAQIVSVALCAVLAVLAIYRVAMAMRAQADTQELLVHQATHDEMTGLPGRMLLTEHADAVLAAGREPITAMFVDLDRFKVVNDSMGHATGDELLVLVAHRLVAAVPKRAMVSRLSGDEFLILARGVTDVEGMMLAERVRTALAAKFELSSGIEVFVSASIGVTSASPGQPTDATTLLREADAAMYRSKDLGRDSVTLFDNSMRERIERRVSLERDLRQAIDDGAISVAYQPIVRWPEQRVIGFEALARWTRDGRPVNPAEFIDIAEESGLIVPLGTFVLDESLRQLAWLRANVPGAANLYVSANLSPRQLQTSDIVDVVAEALERHRVPGPALFLELTESVMMGDQVAATAAMAGLCSLGVRLAVDDFGTGFSSLSYLKRFPFDVVKIDRAFVSGLGHEESDDSLVEAIQSMATALGMTTIAEGVETHEQARRLSIMGCVNMQGHLFSKAVPAADLPELLARLLRAGPAEPTRRHRTAAPAHSI